MESIPGLATPRRLKYVFRRAIFGAEMGKDDGHYCDVLSSEVNVLLVEGS